MKAWLGLEREGLLSAEKPFDVIGRRFETRFMYKTGKGLDRKLRASYLVLERACRRVVGSPLYEKGG